MPHLALMAAAPEVTLCNPKRNLSVILAAIDAAPQSANILVLPSLCLAGATAGALLRSPLLLDAAWEALMKAAKAVPAGMLAVLSLPVKMGEHVYECAALVDGGKLSAFVPRLDEPQSFCFHPGLSIAPTPATHEGVPVLRNGVYSSPSFGDRQLTGRNRFERPVSLSKRRQRDDPLGKRAAIRAAKGARPRLDGSIRLSGRGRIGYGLCL